MVCIRLNSQSIPLSAPDFVNALEDKDHVYFFFREAAVEHINCGKVSCLLSSIVKLQWGPIELDYVTLH